MKTRATISITCEGGPEELDAATSDLILGLREVGADDAAAPESEELEQGARGEVATAGTVLVTLLTSQLATSIVGFVKDWVMRKESRTVKIAAKRGDREVVLEFNPSTVDSAEVKQLLAELYESVKE